MSPRPEQAGEQGRPPYEPSSPVVRRLGRRRFVGAASGGVLLAVHAKSALGGVICQSPSVMVSGNLSPAPNQETCSGGRSPGFWKQPQKFPYWYDAGAVPPEFSVEIGECPTGQSNLSLADIADPGTPVSAALPESGLSPDPGMWAVLAFPNEFPQGQLMRHLIAAWLNAGLFLDYPITRIQIAEMWLAVKDGGLYCPSSIVCTDAMKMSADDVKDYIESMYDFNAEVDRKLCKAESTSTDTSGGGTGGGGNGGGGKGGGKKPK